MSRRRITIIIGSLDIGGAENQLVQVLPRLDNKKWQFEVLTIGHRGPLAGTLVAASIDIVAPPTSNVLARLGSRWRWTKAVIVSFWVWWHLLRNRPAIVHFVLPEAYLIGGFCAWAAGCRRKIMSRRSLNRYLVRRPYLAALERWLHRRMDLIIANSAAVAHDLEREGVPGEKIRLIYNGVDTGRFRPDPSARAAVRSELAIADGAILLITVANLIPYKGHADLIEALGKVIKDLPAGWRLICVGRDDGVGARLTCRAGELGIADNIRLCGQRQDVARLLSAADIGILCSHEEGFPNAVLEGMAAGLPMIATDVGGTHEAMGECEVGRLVPPHDPDALAGAIVELANDPALRQKMGDAARSRALHGYGFERCAAGYDSAYNSLVGP